MRYLIPFLLLCIIISCKGARTHQTGSHQSDASKVKADTAVSKSAHSEMLGKYAVADSLCPLSLQIFMKGAEFHYSFRSPGKQVTDEALRISEEDGEISL
jgi:hypothetical protein